MTETQLGLSPVELGYYIELYQNPAAIESNTEGVEEIY